MLLKERFCTNKGGPLYVRGLLKSVFKKPSLVRTMVALYMLEIFHRAFSRTEFCTTMLENFPKVFPKMSFSTNEDRLLNNKVFLANVFTCRDFYKQGWTP